MKILVSCVVTTTFLLAHSAHATKFNAKVTASKEYLEALEEAESSRFSNNKDYYWKLPNSIIPVETASINFTTEAAAVIFKDDAEPSKPDEITNINVHAGKMEKTVIVARPGSTIKFTNISPFNQELYSPDLSSFKPEVQSTKAFRSIDFPSEGIFTIRSKTFPSFLAYVVITQGKTLDIKSDGTITEELDLGKYTLKIFHNGRWIHKESFTIDTGKIEPLNVTLSPSKDSTDNDRADNKAEDKNEKNETPKTEKKSN